MVGGYAVVRILRLCVDILNAADRLYHQATNQIRKVGKRIDRAVFYLLDCKPGSFGYPAYRENQLAQALALKPFLDRDLPARFGAHCDERLVEYPWFLDALPPGRGRLLDAGSVLNSDLILKQPKLAEKRITITTLAPEDQAHWWKGVSYTYEDIRELSFRDEYFDWVVCISTLEHVGLDNTRFYTSDATKRENKTEDYLLFLDQLKRVLKPGGMLFLTVPYGTYSHEGWLQVFDDSRIAQLVMRFRPSKVLAHYYRYQSGQWQRATAVQCADAGYFGQKQNVANPQGVVAAESVCCLLLVK